MEDKMIVGGWSEFKTDISDEEMSVFSQSMEHFVGVKYTPIAVATQVVSGMNYCYFCNAKAAYPNSPNEAAMVEIYKPIKGDAHITQIRKYIL
ncbi:hypothetical protein [Oceanotoga teriensis]|jgi:hypothetical protein|uniref:Uncharacterized protein n=1 Tax=Oceanotoga teriensis TaxID=515440 RepID=A0AA45C7X1_9BACT|nr:hypothetical protein [Oceanotoga teriensis]MDO7976991.1 hypothetical protein [Oceanotoga teriensis]PWJ95707.1 hypothetical protein C7380_104126 [Oceanotoga teriensis]